MNQPAGAVLPPPPFPAPPHSPVGSIESPWLTETGKAIRDRMRELLPLIREDAQEGERIGSLTPRVLAALTEAGVYSMSMPFEWGGTALGTRDLVEVIAALGEADGSAAWAAFVGVGVKNLLALNDDVVSEVRENTEGWVGPAIVGASVFATNVGRGRRVEGGWMVEGRWAFGSGCKHARWALVGIEYDPATHPGSGRAVVLLERDQYEIVDDWHVSGLSGTSSNSVRVTEEVFVAEHRYLDLSEYPQRFQQLHERYTGPAYQQGGTALLISVAVANVAITIGMARGALGCFAEQARKRKPFTLPYPTVADMASAQVAAGKALAMIDLSAATVEGIADQVDARTAAGLDFSFEEESRISLALAYAANLCEDAIIILQKTLGSSTVVLSNPIQRFARDARVLTSHGAIRLDPQAELNGRRLLGLPPFAMFGGAVPERRAEPKPEGFRP
ncbi:MAG: oxidoreductase [Herbiconiux sp.]|uniref:acyl-CoA dehydrogenase family protein n=1 Tax=Herbiconiux sp. TaxID=1871186 RepID=UPI0011F52C31|nr:acyl-CoA dehydrogenase family protein [Herbiconiux sp.]TAJ48488.1 MAG: oxidoreductase [Herbiconiux sp.]